MKNHHYITLPSGMRLVLNTMKNTQSLSIGVYVGAGSAHEAKNENGLSHFIEHMCFKGTTTRSALDIAEETERIGAQINAFTSKEMTAYFTVSLNTHAETCMELLSDLFFNATFTDENIEKEKMVVLEEIHGSEDDPSDLCHDLLSAAYFGDSGLGRPILGTEARVQSFTRDDILDYMKRHYTADNTVLSVAGNITLAKLMPLVERYFDTQFQAKTRAPRPPHKTSKRSRIQTKEKPIEQVNLAYAFPAGKYGAREKQAVSLLANVLGGGMSSRLFQKVREELGLVYDIYAAPFEYQEEGYFTVFLATSPNYVQKAVDAVRDVICALVEEGITAEELYKGKEQIKSGLILGTESSRAVMRAAASRALLLNKTFDIKKEYKKVDALTLEDVNRALRKIFRFEKVAASYVGKKADVDILERIKCKPEA